jgi:hypothetical protein
MDKLILDFIENIDIENEIRDTFHVSLDQIEAIYVNGDNITVEITDQGQRKALQYKEEAWPTEIMAYFGYYWFKELWLNWDITSLLLLKRVAFYEPGIQRFVFDSKNNICPDQCDNPQRFWIFKFSHFTSDQVGIQPFKQIVKDKDYVAYRLYIVPIAK